MEETVQPTDLPERFIGSQKVVKSIEDNGRVTFTLEDNSGDTFTVEQFEAVVREEPYDDGMVRVYKWSRAVSEIVDILLKNDMKLIEKDFVAGRVDSTIIENYQQAAAKLFGAKSEHLITLEQIDKVLKA